MAGKEEIIKEILDRELEMFLSVPSRYPAPCRSNPQGFRHTRAAQFSVWSGEALASYLEDLKTAEQQDRNLMTLKYARMENLIHELHDDLQVKERIHRIVSVQLKWQKEMAARYPLLMKRGRPLEASENSVGTTSFVNYLRCELETYSESTLSHLFRDLLEAEKRGENLTEAIYLDMVKKLGYRSIKDAETRIREGKA